VSVSLLTASQRRKTLSTTTKDGYYICVWGIGVRRVSAEMGHQEELLRCKLFEIRCDILVTVNHFILKV
jgi:hypothetical protein